MRIRQGYLLRETQDSRMVVATGRQAESFHGMIRLNASGALLYKRLEQGASEDDLVEALLQTYQVTESRARADAVAFLDVLADAGLLTD